MADSVVLQYETLGNSNQPAVIIIHGLFGDKDNLKSLAKELKDDYYCVLVDARNHGESPHCDSMSYPQMAADIVTTANQLKLPQFALVGHSMGGKIAMQVCLDTPQKVTKAVFADIAPVAYEGAHNDILAALQQLDLTQVSSRGDADRQLKDSIPVPGVRQFLLKNLRKTEQGFSWRLNLQAINQQYQQVAGAVGGGQYDGPVLFIKGGESNYLQEQHRAAISERFSNTNVKVIQGTGHWLHAEKPRLFNRTVLQFLNR